MNISRECVDKTQNNRHEPVAYVSTTGLNDIEWTDASHSLNYGDALYTHPEKTEDEPNWKEMYWEMHDLNHKHWYELQVAKAEIKLLKTKTLTDYEISDCIRLFPIYPQPSDMHNFAKAILRKAQEK